MLILSELFLTVYFNYFELENGVMTTRNLVRFYRLFSHAYVLPSLCLYKVIFFSFLGKSLTLH